MRILLIEDDRFVAKTLAMALESHDMQVDHAYGGKEALELVGRHDYHVVTLDLGLPDIGGDKVLTHLRHADKHTPVIVLSGRDDIEIRLACLQNGADDFLIKPFDIHEMVARIQALIRRANGHAQNKLQFGDLTLDLQTRNVLVNDKTLRVTMTEYKILELLCLKSGGVVSKESFLKHLYDGTDAPELKVIDVFIHGIRKKMKDAGLTHPQIETSRGRGYRIAYPN